MCGRVRRCEGGKNPQETSPLGSCDEKGDLMCVFVLPNMSAAWSPTDRSRALARLVEETCQRMRMTRDDFADRAGMTSKQLSDALTQKRPLNLWRLANVAGFFRTFLEVVAEEENCVVFDKELVSMILTVEARPRPMAKATLDTPQQPQAAGGRR